MADSSYHLNSRPPVRALVIAAVASVVGAGLLVLAVNQAWHVAVIVVAAVLLALGLLLCLAAFSSAARASATLTLTDAGYLMVGSGEELSGEWDDVSRVTIGQDRHLTIHHGPERRTHVILRGVPAQVVADVVNDVRERVIAAKG